MKYKMGCLLCLNSYCGSWFDFGIVVTFMLLGIKTFHIRLWKRKKDEVTK